MYKVNQALDRTDLSGVERLYIDKTSFKNGHGYVTLVCDQDRRIIFVCEGKNSETINRLAIRPKAHNGRRESIGFVSCDLGEAYPSGVRRNFFKARVVYDEFHTVKLIVKAMDDTACRVVESQTIKACTRHLMRINPEFVTWYLRICAHVRAYGRERQRPPIVRVFRGIPRFSLTALLSAETKGPGLRTPSSHSESAWNAIKTCHDDPDHVIEIAVDAPYHLPLGNLHRK